MTVTDLPTRAPASAHPPLRHRPAPCTEPPYEPVPEPPAPPEGATGPAATAPHSRAPVVQGTLALSFQLPSGRPAAPPPAALRLVRSEADEVADAGEFGPQPTTSSALPSARTWAGRVVQAIVEVLGGVRPVGQLVRWTSAEVYDEIAELVVPGPVHPQCGPPRGMVRSVHVTEPADGVAEVCALVRRGARSTAVALRLEGRDGRWQCTALELG